MKISELNEILNGEPLSFYKDKKINKIKTDTRTLEKGDVFLALKGNNYDGHKFIDEALKKASCVIVCEKMTRKKANIIYVKDTYEALFKIASYYRKKYPCFFIAITGSVGKTTTKELLYKMLSTKYNVLKTEKNFNNHIGVPLTLFNLDETKEIGIIEMGMNHEGEIEKLSNLVNPDIALITKIGSSHIGNLKSKKNILKAKMEITKGIKDGILLVNGKDNYLKNIKSASNYEVVKTNNLIKYYDVKETLEKLSFKILYEDKTYNITLNITGKHIIPNIILAMTVSLLLDIEMNKIIEVLKDFKLEKGRMEVIKKDNYIIINDCYNASIESFIGALDFIKKQKNSKILIIGDMLELGKYSKYYHKKLGKKLRKIKNSEILLIGNNTKLIKGNNMHHFDTIDEIEAYLKDKDLKDKIIFIKASRRLELEKLIDKLN